MTYMGTTRNALILLACCLCLLAGCKQRKQDVAKERPIAQTPTATPIAAKTALETQYDQMIIYVASETIFLCPNYYDRDGDIFVSEGLHLDSSYPISSKELGPVLLSLLGKRVKYENASETLEYNTDKFECEKKLGPKRNIRGEYIYENGKRLDTWLSTGKVNVFLLRKRFQLTEANGKMYFEIFPNADSSDWIYSLGEYDELQKASELMLRQYFDLGKRLKVLYDAKEILRQKYGDDFSEKEQEIDQYIKHLSKLGAKLVPATNTFLLIAKDVMMKLDVLQYEKQALHGFQTFEQQIEHANIQQSESLEKTIDEIIAAVDALEKAMNE